MGFYGSICLSDLSELVRNNPELVQKSKNGKTYLNVDVYVKDEIDQYGNKASISVKGGEKRVYLGNLKESVKPEGKLEVKPKAIQPSDDFELF